MKTYEPDSVAEFGKRFTEALERKNGGNKSEMARALGCSPQAVTKWAAGVQFPRDNLLRKSASYLDVSLEWLRFGQPEAAPSPPPQQFLLVYVQFDEIEFLSMYRELSDNGKRQFKAAAAAAERLPAEALPAKFQRG